MFKNLSFSDVGIIHNQFCIRKANDLISDVVQIQSYIITPLQWDSGFYIIAFSRDTFNQSFKSKFFPHEPISSLSSFVNRKSKKTNLTFFILDATKAGLVFSMSKFFIGTTTQGRNLFSCNYSSAIILTQYPFLLTYRFGARGR